MSLLAWFAKRTPQQARELASQLEDERWERRKQALVRLRRFGPAAAETVPTLARLLREPVRFERDLRRETLDVLSAIGEQAQESLPIVLNLLLEPNESLRAAAVRTVGKIAIYPVHRAAFDEVFSRLSDEHMQVRVAACEALCDMGYDGDQGYQGAIEEMESHSFRRVVQSHPLASGGLGQQVVWDRDIATRHSLRKMLILGAMKAPRYDRLGKACALLLGLCDIVDPDVVVDVFDSLVVANRWPPVHGDRSEMTGDELCAEHVKAAQVFGFLSRHLTDTDVDAVIAELLHFLDRQSYEHRIPALVALRRIAKRPDAVVPVLCACLRWNNTLGSEFNDALVTTLGRYGSDAREAIAPILTYLKGPFRSWSIVLCALVLAQIGADAAGQIPPDRLKWLFEQLKDGGVHREQTETQRIIRFSGLGGFGSPQRTAVLRQFLSSRHPSIRKETRRALYRLGQVTN